MRKTKGISNTITFMQCSNDSLTSNTKDITKILNNYFQSVFTNSAILPDVPAVEKQDLVVTEEGVLGLLKSLTIQVGRPQDQMVWISRNYVLLLNTLLLF